MPKYNHDAKIGFVLNDFTNLRDDELSLLIKLKYDKYIEYVILILKSIVILMLENYLLNTLINYKIA